MYRFFVDNKKNDHFVLSDDLLKHIKVLRIKNENIICIFEEVFYICKLENNLAMIIEKSDDLNEYENQVILCPTLINIKRFEWLIQKSAELGATKLIPMFSKNMNIKYKDISKNKMIRWREISKNACEQSFRNKIMSIEDPIDFEQAIKIIAKYKVIAHEKINSKKINSLSDDIIILVGPEGGFTENEINLAKNNGFDIVNLGNRILRSETSSIFLLSIIK
ncbi:MAG: 16S rRNA (uracil(1498)-N(3))-methyltransferase [Mycoplasmataceae bacterium]|nr:16S rRNA (uracil(1498)-N(3))-methyltransferase [Mycoplasmataceae bacterium]